MNGPIETEASLLTLEEDFQEWLETLPGDMPRVAAEALDRMAIRPGRPPQWTRRLSPLVALYPALQAPILAEVSPSLVRDLGLAHLLLMVHAFLSDRQLDGQLALTPAECVLSTQALLAGLATLDLQASDGHRESRGSTLRLLRSHHGAQLCAYPDGSSDQGEDERAVFRLVAERALPGWLATRVLLQRLPPKARERAKQAFDHLVVGLQWTDDLVDWSQDLDRAQENLLLRRLHLPLIEAVTVRDVDLEPRLVAEGVYAEAFARIDRHLGWAREIQEELGAVQLAALVDDLRSEMGGLRGRLEGLIDGQASGFGAGGRSSE